MYYFFLKQLTYLFIFFDLICKVFFFTSLYNLLLTIKSKVLIDIKLFIICNCLIRSVYVIFIRYPCDRFVQLAYELLKFNGKNRICITERLS